MSKRWYYEITDKNGRVSKHGYVEEITELQDIVEGDLPFYEIGDIKVKYALGDTVKSYVTPT